MQRRPVRKDDTMLNESIRSKEVLVIDQNGEKLGIKSRTEAINLAYSQGLDLVCVAPGSKPPVTRIMDYNKFRYEQQKKDREARKNQKIVSLKEVRLSPQIDKHDFETKLKNARKFLEKGDKLKISIRFKGRMIAYTKQGRDVILQFAKDCSDIADVEKAAKLDGRSMFMIITPKKNN